MVNPFILMVSARKEYEIDPKILKMKKNDIYKFDPYVYGQKLFLIRKPKFMRRQG